MNGYMGVVLRVNLSTGKVSKEPLPAELINKFIGGRGINSKIIFDELPAGIDPLGPENKIIIGTGPCNGTLVPGSCRFTITAKSPMTGIHGDSNAGGFFGVGPKYAGYDHIIIEGKAEKPSYLFIDNDKVEIRSAAGIWGKGAVATQRAIQEELRDPDIKIVAIGPAGENLVRFANLINDLGRASGRTGQGAVFGSKNLKAIAVRGTRGVKVAHPSDLEVAVREIYKGWTASTGKGFNFTHTTDLRAKYGPAAGWPRYDKFGMLPTRNYQGGPFKSMMDGLDKYFHRPKACYSCPAPCDHLFIIDEGPYAGTSGGGMELTILDMGPRIGNENQDLMVKLHSLLDGYGMDYFETGACLSFTMECYEKGILTQADVDGLDMRWDNAEAILKLAELICKKQGFGAVLAEGVKRASEAIGRGSEKLAIQAKGQTVTGRDPRASKGWGLGYAVSSRGPCHVRAYFPETYAPEAWDPDQQPIIAKYKDATNPLLEEGKGELLAINENISAFKNSMEICLFTVYPWLVGSVNKMLSRLFQAVTGTELTPEQILQAGERIINVERAFNVREGLTRKDDTLPVRFLKEPYPSGPAKGQVVNLEPMINDYYHFRGWNQTTGYPTRQKLLELGLEDVAAQLENMNRLA